MAPRSLHPELRRAFEDYCKDANLDPARVMAELVAEFMLSGSDDPVHVYGPDFMSIFDEVMKNANVQS